jgi:hypothetical protein
MHTNLEWGIDHYGDPDGKTNDKDGRIWEKVAAGSPKVLFHHPIRHTLENYEEYRQE